MPKLAGQIAWTALFVMLAVILYGVAASVFYALAAGRCRPETASWIVRILSGIVAGGVTYAALARGGVSPVVSIASITVGVPLLIHAFGWVKVSVHKAYFVVPGSATSPASHPLRVSCWDIVRGYLGSIVYGMIPVALGCFAGLLLWVLLSRSRD